MQLIDEQTFASTHEHPALACFLVGPAMHPRPGISLCASGRGPVHMQGMNFCFFLLVRANVRGSNLDE
jgi:hypothetical protein